MTKSRTKRNKINEAARVTSVTAANLHRLDALLSVILSALLRKGVVSQEELDAEFRLLTKPPEEKPHEPQ
jgi:hypothetical protein